MGVVCPVVASGELLTIFNSLQLQPINKQIKVNEINKGN